LAKLKLESKKRVKSDLEKLPRFIQETIIQAIEALSGNPFPHGKKIKPIKGAKNLYRLRVGDYRVIYELKEKTITVLAVLHRRDLERFLK